MPSAVCGAPQAAPCVSLHGRVHRSLHLWVDGLRRSRRLRRSRCLRISIPVLLLSLFGANRLLFFGAARDAAVCSRFFSFFNLARSRARA